MIKRGGLILSTLVLLLSLFATVFSPVIANASTIYDDVIQTTDTLIMRGSTGCSIDVPNMAAVSTDLVMNDSVTWTGDVNTNKEDVQTMWENRTAYQVVQAGILSGNPNDYYVQIAFTDDPAAYWGFGNYSSGYKYMGLVTPSTGYHWSYLSFTANSTCSTYSVVGGTYGNSNGNTTVGIFLMASMSSYGYAPLARIFANYGTINFPTDYEGSGDPGVPSSKFAIYPTLGISIDNQGEDKNKIIMTMDTDFIDKYHLPSPNYIILTLADYTTEEIIEADSFAGPYPIYENIPNGQYTVHLTVVYTDETITDIYEFKDTFYNIDVNGTDYSIFYNENEGKYCSVRGGYEWNCDIPQPEEESTDVVNGDPETWTDEECSITDIGACIRNALHYLGEYLGINGPSIQPGSSPFFQFDTNTFGLTAILTAPIAILNNLATAEYTCNTVTLPLPFIDSDLPLPCMNSYYTTYLGDLYTIWQRIINGIVAYWVIVNMLKMVKDAKDPQKDQIEVLKL